MTYIIVFGLLLVAPLAILAIGVIFGIWRDINTSSYIQCANAIAQRFSGGNANTS